MAYNYPGWRREMLGREEVCGAYYLVFLIGKGPKGLRKIITKAVVTFL
jgi:hypothetical protein